jgi:hypothetical protein
LIFSFIFIIHGGFLHVRFNPIYPRFVSFPRLASRLIRRRVPAAGHLMTPRRLWLNKIPTQCDVVVEFPGKSFCGNQKRFRYRFQFIVFRQRMRPTMPSDGC